MARAGFYQARIVAANTLASIKGVASAKLQIYKPDLAIEAAIKLTLGKVCSKCPGARCDFLANCVID